MRDESPNVAGDDDEWLMHHWILAGIVSASSRFIPIPFVDDIVRERCRRRIVSKTLMAHGQQDRLGDFAAWYDDQGGCLTGCLMSAAKAPLKLLLFPIRKFIAIVTSVRSVPLEVTRSVLLGRTLNRLLASGETQNAAQAEQMRYAFDQAFARMDLHVIRAVVSDALRHASSWKSSAVGSARELAKGDDAPADDIAAAENVQASVTEVQAALEKPEVLALFDEFDARFDRAFDAIGKQRPTA